MAIRDGAGAIVESYEYDAWGNVLAVRDGSGNPLSESAFGNRFLFQGREYSWATGQYNFRARWYDPETGRWLSNDPIGISGGLNLYAFCANNAIIFYDPYGLKLDYSKLNPEEEKIARAQFARACETTPGRLLYKILEDSEVNIIVLVGESGGVYGYQMRIPSYFLDIGGVVEEMNHMAAWITKKRDPANLGIDVSDPDGEPYQESPSVRANNIAQDQYMMKHYPGAGHPVPHFHYNHRFNIRMPYGTKYNPDTDYKKDDWTCKQ